MVKIQIIGHLGKDCVVNTVNGKTVINFTVAHTEKYTDRNGQNVEKTIWVECGYWTDRTAVSTYLTKGKQVFVEGSPDVRTYTKQDGTSASVLMCRVREIQLLGGRGDSAPQQNVMNQQQKSQVQNPADITEPVDDLPF